MLRNIIALAYSFWSSVITSRNVAFYLCDEHSQYLFSVLRTATYRERERDGYDVNVLFTQVREQCNLWNVSVVYV